MQQNIEQEWQFSAAQLESARAWLAARPRDSAARHLAMQPTLEIEDTYFDSSDWMIFRAGFALRMRREHASGEPESAQTEVTLKSLHSSRGALARRQEMTERVTAPDLETVLASVTGIGERIRELIGSRPLAPLFHARTRRERQRLIEADSDLALAEVDLDETSIETASGPARELKRVEVECLHAQPAALALFVDELRDAAHLIPVEHSKFRAGLNAAGLEPNALLTLGSVEITATQSFAESQFALLRRYFTTLLGHEPQVRAGSVVAVHEMRVAARHLDVLLRSFAGFGPRWAVGPRTTLRALISALGAVRDGDVQLAHLQTACGDLPGPDRAAVEPLREQLRLQHGRARVRLLHMLDSHRTRGWVELWLTQLALGTASGIHARETATTVVARNFIRSVARKLRKRADRLTKDSSAGDFHESRKRVKRLRYALDAFGSLYGEPAREYSRVLGKLQHVLGEFHDATVRAERFAGLVTTGRRVPAATSFVVGRLVERDQSALDQCRRKFPKAYGRVKRRRWRELVAEMERVAQLPRAPAAATAAL